MGIKLNWTGLFLIVAAPIFSIGFPFAIVGAVLFAIGIVLMWLDK